ncbi:MAG: divalent-cation tolerance protein CutA [Candidatus Bipolaricaulota bacterium]|nr:divalent-cation tolerance protein CutA [Candidatus Bipolaricaulota bacterium]
MEEYVHVVTTVPTKEEGERIALALLQRHLAGCVQIVGPMTSLYWWQGKIKKSEEWLCIVKTERALFDTIERAITAMHPYKVPEILAIPITEGSEGYLEWLREQTAEARKK